MNDNTNKKAIISQNKKGIKILLIGFISFLIILVISVCSVHLYDSFKYGKMKEDALTQYIKNSTNTNSKINFPKPIVEESNDSIFCEESDLIGTWTASLGGNFSEAFFTFSQDGTGYYYEANYSSSGHDDEDGQGAEYSETQNFKWTLENNSITLKYDNGKTVTYEIDSSGPWWECSNGTKATWSKQNEG